MKTRRKEKKRENDSCQTSRFTEWSIQIHRPYTSGPQNMPRVNRNKLRERYIIAHLLTKQTITHCELVIQSLVYCNWSRRWYDSMQTFMSYVVSCDTDLNTEFWKHPNCTVEFDVIVNYKTSTVWICTLIKKRCTDINFSKMSINGLNFHRYIFWLPKGTQNGWVDGWIRGS